MFGRQPWRRFGPLPLGSGFIDPILGHCSWCSRILITHKFQGFLKSFQQSPTFQKKHNGTNRWISPRPRKEGMVGVVTQENQGSDQPLNIKAPNGQTWWYQEQQNPHSAGWKVHVTEPPHFFVGRVEPKAKGLTLLSVLVLNKSLVASWLVHLLSTCFVVERLDASIRVAYAVLLLDCIILYHFVSWEVVFGISSYPQEKALVPAFALQDDSRLFNPLGCTAATSLEFGHWKEQPQDISKWRSSTNHWTCVFVGVIYNTTQHGFPTSKLGVRGDEFEGVSFTRFPVTQGDLTSSTSWDRAACHSSGWWSRTWNNHSFSKWNRQIKLTSFQFSYHNDYCSSIC